MKTKKKDGRWKRHVHKKVVAGGGGGVASKPVKPFTKKVKSSPANGNPVFECGLSL